MTHTHKTNSRLMLGKLRRALAIEGEGQERLDRIPAIIAESMDCEVCSIYLFRDDETLELCATEGLKPEAVHKTRMRLGEGLVGRVAKFQRILNTDDAPNMRGFRFMPETGEEVFISFLGVPIQRLGERLGVLVVQSKEKRRFLEDEIYALEVVAMVIAEMAELGAFVGEGAALSALHKQARLFRGGVAQEGIAEGNVYLHEPRVVVTNPIGEDSEIEHARLTKAIDTLRVSVDEMLDTAGASDKDQLNVLETYRMFANSKGWINRMQSDIESGLSAEAAVEKEQSLARTRLGQVPDHYLRERLHDLDDLSNRLLRILTGQGEKTGAELPENPILIARNIGPGDLLEYGRKLRGIVLEEGSVGSHATIIARAMAIPLVIHANGITTEALNGDHILVDGEQGVVHLRPDEAVVGAFKDKMAMLEKEQERYSSIRTKPAETLDGEIITLTMNAGLMADLPSLQSSGASGVGLFRTELQFLVRNEMPKRSHLCSLYSKVLAAADGQRVVFRTLDIGSDKVLPYLEPQDEPNPAMGWRAIRVGLDKTGIMRMQLQALIRAANGGPLTVMFPFVAQFEEYRDARAMLETEIQREAKKGHPIPSKIEIGAMLETPSLAFAPDRFFEEVDFISIGGNDLKQFFFAADRENERVRRRYDTLNVSFLTFIERIVRRCNDIGTPVSFCGEDAGRPIEALCFAAMGLRCLSMRPASIGPVKSLLRRTSLSQAKAVIQAARERGDQSVRPAIIGWLRGR